MTGFVLLAQHHCTELHSSHAGREASIPSGGPVSWAGWFKSLPLLTAAPTWAVRSMGHFSPKKINTLEVLPESCKMVYSHQFCQKWSWSLPQKISDAVKSWWAVAHSEDPPPQNPPSHCLLLHHATGLGQSEALHPSCSTSPLRASIPPWLPSPLPLQTNRFWLWGTYLF